MNNIGFLLALLYVLPAMIAIIMSYNDIFTELVYKYRYHLPAWLVSNGNLIFACNFIGVLLPVVNILMIIFYLYDRYKYKKDRLSIVMTDKSIYSFDNERNHVNLSIRYSDDSEMLMRIYEEDGELLLWVNYDYNAMTEDRHYVRNIVHNSLHKIFPDYQYLRLNCNLYEMMHDDRNMCKLDKIKEIIKSNTMIQPEQ